MALSYTEQLQHPLWKQKVKEIMERDGFCCVICGSDMHKLHVHHLCYFPDLLAWEYDNELLQTVCIKHHEQLTYDLPKVSGLIAFECLKENIDISVVVELLKRLDNGRK